MVLENAPAQPPDKPWGDMSVEELATAVRYHNYRYFVLNDPLISDPEFDRLTERLRALQPRHPALRELVPEDVSGQRVAHDTPMLSLDKCFDEAGLRNWLLDERGRPKVRGQLTMSPKVDGVAASLKYRPDGRLRLALTRGDGQRGEVFTPNAHFIDAIPKALPEAPSGGGEGAGGSSDETGGAAANPGSEAEIDVRGELYMTLSAFRQLPEGFTSPRNTTAGALKQKDPRNTGKFPLSFFVYDVRGVGLRTEMDKMAWAERHGFQPVPTELVDPDEAQAGYERWLARRDELDYEVDGVVFKANDLAEQQRLGTTSHHPRYAIAYKFPGDSGRSTLRRIDWSVSRTGAITPVAVIDPIELDGAQVSRCSLHNLTILRELDASIGATVVAMRRGGVIPHVEAVVEPGDLPIELPNACPACGSPTRTVRRMHAETSSAAGRQVDILECSEPLSCPAVVEGTLDHYTHTVRIDGFGPKILRQLVERRIVRTPADFYRLGPEDLVPLERIGDKLARKLVRNIQATTELSLPVFLQALGVEGLGEAMSRQLAEHFETIDRILALTPDELVELEGYGPTLARIIVEGLRDRKPLADELRQFVHVQPYRTELRPEAADSPIAGKAFVFTGAMQTMDRKTAQKRVRELGGRTPSSVSRELDFLVVGDEGSPLLGEGQKSSKQRKVERYREGGTDIHIIPESEFLELLGERPSEQA